MYHKDQGAKELLRSQKRLKVPREHLTLGGTDSSDVTGDHQWNAQHADWPDPGPDGSSDFYEDQFRLGNANSIRPTAPYDADRQRALLEGPFHRAPVQQLSLTCPTNDPAPCSILASCRATSAGSSPVLSEGLRSKGSPSLFEKLVLEGMAGVTPQNWFRDCTHVIRLEDEAWERDGIIDSQRESLIISLGTDSSTSDESNSSDMSGIDELP
ncbi:hypothetical protein HPB49_009465 [Dermacentor silvarum]|uniref:Uncharacterized protein n=1 Tax=Dermacentor silvarum TaxID=543639 RepID=A0ACB8D3T3_DERSI|nr:hypothetical protein HPB49_009465 [Dermacentor silvarum]